MDLFLPAERRREILCDVGRMWGLSLFIETGTYEGATTFFLRDHFSELYTIELDLRWYTKACALFEPYPQVHCRFGDSAKVLPMVLEEITEAALVWLDGHHSGPGTALASLSTPIREELRTLLEDPRPHVILVDDARCFEGGAEHHLYEHYADWPSLSWVKELAESHSYRFKIEGDIIYLVPAY